MLKPIVGLAMVGLFAAVAAGDEAHGTLTVRVRNGSAPVRAAVVSAGGLAAQTDVRGECQLALPVGEQELTVKRAGFEPATLRVTVRAGQETVAVVQLPEQTLEEHVTVVSATRSRTLVEDQAIRVEALPQEEIEENSTVAPGNITTLLEEIGGLRVQAVSPALGGANFRLQGLGGRYTQILIDELPLYGEVPDAFNLLQIPPLDLGQVEVIKGAASALYGGTALGGIVNLVSRRPEGELEPEVLLNQTVHGGTDASGFLPGRLSSRWGYTLLGAADWQRERDLDHDGWADLAGYRRRVVRPRLFWADGHGDSLLFTIGGTSEERKGGTVGDSVTPEGAAFTESLATRHLDGGIVGRFLVHGDRLISLHASFGSAWHDHRFAEDRERDVRSSGSSEVSLSGSNRGHTWVLGAAVLYRHYRVTEIGGFESTSTAPGLFVQDEYSLSEHFAVSASARADFDSVYGAFLNPRLSVLVRPGQGFHLRFSAGTGSSVPTPFLDETEAVGFSRVLPPRDLEAERAESASVDAGFTRGHFELGDTLFVSRVAHALLLRPVTGELERFEIANAPTPTDSYGSQFFTRYVNGSLHIILAHTYLHSTEADPEAAGRRETPLTPRHAGELAVLWESEKRGRLGLEISYTGRQSLEHDPYRSESVAFFDINVLGEVRLEGETGIFVNLTNLAGVRQTRYDPLLLPARAPDGRFTTDLWAPLEGRSVNAGVRMAF